MREDDTEDEGNDGKVETIEKEVRPEWMNLYSY